MICGSVLDLWKCFVICGSVLDLWKCFGFVQVFCPDEPPYYPFNYKILPKNCRFQPLNQCFGCHDAKWALVLLKKLSFSEKR